MQKVKALSENIRRALSGDYRLNPADYEKGELSALSADLYKLTVRMREQQEKLLQDKRFLADSLSDISHQLKTPITSMSMLADLLQQDLPEQKRKEFTESLNLQLDRLQWLVKRFCFFPAWMRKRFCIIREKRATGISSHAVCTEIASPAEEAGLAVV
ncbi:MAG: hypothetical protein GX291_07835 [Tissierellia bacterium]|nr:histidine kinase dimerization/phospho-acceptor domain-containing protein [Bacillota bacterium]NLK59160.1 hypothetical protein [Tissierellia bacterium]